jgi:hypothetical protein
MDLAAARQLIQTSLARMDALYRRPLFDEWAILSAGAQPGILAYAGPRPETFRRELPTDSSPLRALIADRELGEGDFEFATEAGGTHYDACMKLGPASFLVCNHTARAMTEIRQDPQWLKAQAEFFALSERFRADPLVA